jgi:putative sigma-54 modulation protein
LKITLQTLHFKADKELEAYVHDKVSKLFDLSSKIIRAEVSLFEGASGEINKCYCEIRLVIPGYDHFVKKNTMSYEQSIIDAIDALQNIIEKEKK